METKKIIKSASSSKIQLEAKTLKTIKSAPTSKSPFDPKALKNEYENLARKSQYIPSSRLIFKEKVTPKQISHHVIAPTISKIQNNNQETVTPIPTRIQIKKRVTEIPKSNNINKYISFYQSSKIIILNKIRPAFSR